MRLLYVNGQDIASIVLGMVEDGAWVTRPTAVSASPEQALHAIDGYMREQGIDRSSLDGLVLVRGPGSATSLRTTLALANAWAFAQGIVLKGIEKSRDEDDAALLERIASAHAVPMLTPVYESAAKITPSGKDKLLRRRT